MTLDNLDITTALQHIDKASLYVSAIENAITNQNDDLRSIDMNCGRIPTWLNTVANLKHELELLKVVLTK